MKIPPASAVWGMLILVTLTIGFSLWAIFKPGSADSTPDYHFQLNANPLNETFVESDTIAYKRDRTNKGQKVKRRKSDKGKVQVHSNKKKTGKEQSPSKGTPLDDKY